MPVVNSVSDLERIIVGLGGAFLPVDVVVWVEARESSRGVEILNGAAGTRLANGRKGNNPRAIGGPDLRKGRLVNVAEVPQLTSA